jgi:hypothetical protein
MTHSTTLDVGLDVHKVVPTPRISAGSTVDVAGPASCLTPRLLQEASTM